VQLRCSRLDLVGFISNELREELRAVGPDRALDAPGRHAEAEVDEGGVPRVDVEEVRVDKRAVDVEQDRVRGGVTCLSDGSLLVFDAR
jgi:hypothetical protein